MPKITNALSPAQCSSAINKIIKFTRHHIFLTIIFGLGTLFAVGYAIHRCTSKPSRPKSTADNRVEYIKVINKKNFKFEEFASACNFDKWTMYRCIYHERSTFNTNIDKLNFERLLKDPNSALHQSANTAYFLLANTDDDRFSRLNAIRKNTGSTREAIDQLINHSNLKDKNDPLYQWFIQYIKTSLSNNDVPSAVNTLNSFKTHYINCEHVSIFGIKLATIALGKDPKKRTTANPSDLPLSVSDIMTDLTEAEKKQLPADILN